MVYCRKIDPPRHCVYGRDGKQLEIIKPESQFRPLKLRIIGKYNGINGEIILERHHLVKLFKEMRDEGDLG